MYIRNIVTGVTLCLFIPALALAGDDLETQVNAQQATMLRIQNSLDQMQSQIDQQNGRIEELSHEVSELKSRLDAVKSQSAQSSDGQNAGQDASGNGTDANGAGAQQNTSAQQSNAGQGATAGAAQGPVTDAKGNSLKPSDANAKAMYSKAYNLVVSNKLSDSIPAFKAFIQKYPDSDLAPNAWYWLGQVQFKLKQYQDARVSFLNAAGFRNSPKRADSLYKLGLIYKLSGDKEKANKFFEVVAKQYPNDTAAALARKQLASN